MELEGKYEGNTVAGIYERLETDRSPFYYRARDCSELTIPTLVPPMMDNPGAYKFKTPYQGVGARGVNNIASKLLLALLPAHQSFFRLSVDNKVLDELGAARGTAEEALVEIENRVLKEVNSSQIRVKVFEALKHLVVAGNALLYLPPKENTLKVYPIQRYVVERDPIGNVLQIVTKEKVDIESLDEALIKEAQINTDEEETTIYTHVKLKDGRWEVQQEINGQIIESTKTTYAKDKSPFLPLRLIVVDGESYGRSYVEEYLGDLKSLEGLTKAIIEGSAAAAKLLIFVSPNGTTRKRTIAEAANLAVVEGNAQDVTAFKVEKGSDFGVALQASNGITERLSFAFMLNSAVQRNAERVTAEEIRYVANELEETLGGVYSVLGAEFQLPLAKLLMSRMQRQGKIPALPKDMVDPIIITGVEALGRQADMQRLDMFTQSLAVLGPEVLNKYINVTEYIKRRCAALNVDSTDLVKSEEQLQQEMQEQQQMQQQQQMMGMMQAGVPNAVKGMMDSGMQQQQAEADMAMAEQQQEPQ
jgi:hypothetical protein